MTEKLKALMERTAEVDFAPVDLRAIAAAGDRTVRRRRLALGAGALALVIIAGGAALALGKGGGEREHIAQDPVGAPLGVVTWTWDKALHTTSASYPLGHEVKAYVRTAVGYAFVDPAGVVYSYVEGRVERIGRLSTDDTRLVADDEGDLVGWTEVGSGQPRFVVHDLRAQETIDLGEARPGPPADGEETLSARFSAIDGRTAYVQDARGALAVDVDTHALRVIDPRTRDDLAIYAVEDGQMAFAEGEQPLRIGRTVAQSRSFPDLWGGPVYFSPDGRYVSLDADEPRVYVVATGRQVPIDIDGRSFGTGYEWLDAHTVVFAASRAEVGPLELLTCEVPSGRCTQVVADLVAFADIEGRIALADGRSTN